MFLILSFFHAFSFSIVGYRRLWLFPDLMEGRGLHRTIIDKMDAYWILSGSITPHFNAFVPLGPLVVTPVIGGVLGPLGGQSMESVIEKGNPDIGIISAARK